ncbi:NAD(P)-dependent oxidoreductase [Psychromonas sp. KJ10-10]|uniref:NAD(P)-dependent oxidoreductase n=1 Tax=Psychromonas sp. KJ10-10 TaxID=3391823 RepID=UPI0039B6C238
MKKYKILATESFQIPNPLDASICIDIVDGLWKDHSALIKKALQYDALIVRNMTQIDATLMDQLSSIKVIGRLGAGTENIDCDHAQKCNIAVVYAPVQNTNAVAEYCVAQCFNAFRNLPSAIDEAKQGIWNRAKYLASGKEISGATVGVIGFGHIGKSFAQKMSALGANVLIYNRTASNIKPPFQQTDLITLLKKSDIVSIHLPGGDKTKDFINKENIGFINKDAFILNSSRGGVINEVALLTALKSGQIKGAILDVRSIEPATADELAQHENVTVTPHIAAFTQQSQTAISESIVLDIFKVLQGEPPLYPVSVA